MNVIYAINVLKLINIAFDGGPKDVNIGEEELKLLIYTGNLGQMSKVHAYLSECVFMV